VRSTDQLIQHTEFVLRVKLGKLGRAQGLRVAGGSMRASLDIARALDEDQVGEFVVLPALPILRWSAEQTRDLILIRFTGCSKLRSVGWCVLLMKTKSGSLFLPSTIYLLNIM